MLHLQFKMGYVIVKGKPFFEGKEIKGLQNPEHFVNVGDGYAVCLNQYLYNGKIFEASLRFNPIENLGDGYAAIGSDFLCNKFYYKGKYLKDAIGSEYIGNGYLKSSLHLYYNGEIVKFDKHTKYDSHSVKALPVCTLKIDLTLQEHAKGIPIYEEVKRDTPSDIVSMVKSELKEEEEKKQRFMQIGFDKRNFM